MSGNVSKWGMGWNYLLGVMDPSSTGGESVSDYLKEEMDTDEEVELVRKAAYLAGSDARSANWGFWPAGFDNIFTGEVGGYHGQRPLTMNELSTDRTASISRYGVSPAPNLLKTFFGYESPEEMGLTDSPVVPSRRPYSFGENERIYDVTPFVEFKWFQGSRENLDILNKRIENLNEGEVLRLSDVEGVDVSHFTDLDLGRINWSIGVEGGKPFLSLADSWDFAGSTGALGDIMDMIGAEDINFYGRFGITDDSFVEYEDSDDVYNVYQKDFEKYGGF